MAVPGRKETSYWQAWRVAVTRLSNKISFPICSVFKSEIAELLTCTKCLDFDSSAWQGDKRFVA